MSNSTMLQPSDAVSRTPGDPFSHEPAFPRHKEPLLVMEGTGEREMEPLAGCNPDEREGQVPDSPAAPSAVGPEESQFSPAAQDETSREILSRGSRPTKSGAAALAHSIRLPQFVQALTEQMLVQGASAEDVAQAARECGFTQITAAKVDRWLGQNTEARKRIIQHQVKTPKGLKGFLRASGAPPDAIGEDAALLAKRAESASAGTSSSLDAPDLAAIHRSLRTQLQTENESLKRRAKRLEARKAYLARRIEHAQMRLDHARLEVVQRRLGDLRSALEECESPQQETGRSVFADIVTSLCQLLKNGD